MKSLEIVNNTIVKQQTIEVKGNDRLPSIFVDDIRIAGVKWNDSPDANYISAKLNTHSRVISMENLEQIKQDLEVLEILRENLYLWYTRYWNEEIEIHTKLTTYTNPKEFQKVKQWLEENNNERD